MSHLEEEASIVNKLNVCSTMTQNLGHLLCNAEHICITLTVITAGAPYHLIITLESRLKTFLVAFLEA